MQHQATGCAPLGQGRLGDGGSACGLRRPQIPRNITAPYVTPFGNLTGDGVVVVIIDTGCLASHQEFSHLSRKTQVNPFPALHSRTRQGHWQEHIVSTAVTEGEGDDDDNVDDDSRPGGVVQVHGPEH
jgi:hypothetical protein